VRVAGTNTLLQVPILKGAAEQLVTRRELRNVYQTNQDIKTYAAWFIFKALTTTGLIKNYINQSAHLCAVLHCSEGTLRGLVARMKEKKLLTVEPGRNLRLVSYDDAAQILQIIYTGTEPLKYDYAKQTGNQVFSYILRLKEIENAKADQLKGLTYHIAKNPLLLDEVCQELYQRGATEEELATASGFQRWLLRLQVQTFIHGGTESSFDIIHRRRADIDRSLRTIQDAHHYQHHASVTYLKKVLVKYRLAIITKQACTSKVRSKLYYTDKNGERRERYHWNKITKTTTLPLCDSITARPLSHL
jgi:hypothetical protein